VIARLPSDPTLELIEKAGARVETSREGHAVADGTVWVSGEIPRITDFEAGLLGGVRWFESENDNKGGWVKEEVLSTLFPSTLDTC
jgi:7,8-dihydropterin-6-yl-methyl-4-(beta-D-ribofuranosyl)aminobenzene 5'-phosphate synthase